jgi:hypothetical protein
MKSLTLKNIYYQSPIDVVKENYNIIKRNGYVILEKAGAENIGDVYEREIRNLFLKTKMGGPATTTKKAARNRWAADADLNVYGDLLNIEIKANPGALLGSLSIKFDGKDGFQGFSSNESLEPEFYDLLSKLIIDNDKKIRNLIHFIHKADPEANPKFPTVMWKDLYDSNRDNITSFYITGKFPMSAVHELYANKNVFYMQIGKKGLFYLKQKHGFMPDDLPQLDGVIEFQIRPKPGSGERAGRKVAKITLSIDFKFNIPSSLDQSPYTVDSKEGIQKLLKSIKDKKAKQ